MPANILNSIYNIVEFGNLDLSFYATTSQIRINSVGESLEYFIKDSIVNCARAITGLFRFPSKDRVQSVSKSLPDYAISYLSNQFACGGFAIVRIPSYLCCN
jgi:hypothetical protein